MDPYEPEVMAKVRYALLEGWHVYRSKCADCGHDWPAAVEPGNQARFFECPKCHKMRGQRYWFMQVFEC